MMMWLRAIGMEQVDPEKMEEKLLEGSGKSSILKTSGGNYTRSMLGNNLVYWNSINDRDVPSNMGISTGMFHFHSEKRNFAFFCKVEESDPCDMAGTVLIHIVADHGDVPLHVDVPVLMPFRNKGADSGCHVQLSCFAEHADYYSSEEDLMDKTGINRERNTIWNGIKQNMIIQ